jgi:hypothetical protein
MSGLKRLAKSSAAIVLALAVTGAIVMAGIGRISGDQALDFIKWLVVAFFLKVGAEDAASKYAIGKASGKAPSDAPDAPDAPGGTVDAGGIFGDKKVEIPDKPGM